MNRLSKIIKKFFSARRNVVIFLVILTIGIFASWKMLGNRNEQPEYQTARVERGTIVSTVAASGNVLTANLMRVTTEASGVVEKVYVKDGDKVVAGQKLAEIMLGQDGQQKNASAWSSYLSAKNSVDSSNATIYTLQSQMFAANQKFINDAVARNLATNDPTYIQQNADWLAAEAKYKNQTAVIQQSKAALSSNWLSYQATSPIVTAPIAGTINNTGLVEGMILGSQGGSSETTASFQEVAVIANDTNPLLTFSLTEIDVPKIKIGQKATINLDSLPEKTFTGSVTAINKVGTTSNNVTSYPLIIKLDTNSPAILPNMAASASIILETKADVLLAPSIAIQTQNRESFARVLRNGQEEQVPVQVGLSSDTQIEIISGLSQGSEVITGTATGASSGQNNGSSPFGAGFRPGGGFGGGALRPGGFRGGGGDQH